MCFQNDFSEKEAEQNRSDSAHYRTMRTNLEIDLLSREKYFITTKAL